MFSVSHCCREIVHSGHSFKHQIVLFYYQHNKGKCKGTPITGVCGPECSGRLRLQITRHSAHEGDKVVTLTHRPPLLPGISWYSFLEAESTRGTWKCQLPQNKFQASLPGIDPGSYRCIYTHFQFLLHGRHSPLYFEDHSVNFEGNEYPLIIFVIKNNFIAFFFSLCLCKGTFKQIRDLRD